MFSFQTNIVLMTVAVSFVISWHLVENCQYFGRIRFLFLYVFTVPSQDHNLINHHEKVKYFVPVLTSSWCLASNVPTTVAASSSPPLPSMGNKLCVLYLDRAVGKM